MSLGGGGGGQMQELQQQMQAIEQEIESLDEEIEEIRQEKTGVDEAVEAVERLDSGDTVQVPLGGGAYVRAEVADIDEIVVELGGGYAAERDQAGAIESLNRRKDLLDEQIADVQEEVAELEAESDQLEQQAQQMQQQQMQQLQQQMGQQDDGDGDDE
ncbi:prefoldin subunit alpha [Halomarina oriensis]|uniref:Prefoldin subunit alpha n=1 Tax=Halomarina oriensis TaxID=671145 RepID=A0A6B0GLM6_9EURY|nr:prefoldin subunit alpha [Halomarina oriensis]MWG34369.1 prefoldin subunit alpha [Halomarina oriensis]